MAMEGAFLQCSRAPLSSTATRSLNTTCSLKFSWSSSVSKFLNNFDGKCDALGTTGVRYCIGAKGRLRNEDTVKPRKPKSPKLHRTWTPGWTAPPRRELGNFDAVDRIDLNRNPTTTQGDVESSKPVVDYERQSRGDLSKTALQCEHFQKYGRFPPLSSVGIVGIIFSCLIYCMLFIHSMCNSNSGFHVMIPRRLKS